MQNIHFKVAVFQNNENVIRRFALEKPVTSSPDSSKEISFALLKKELAFVYKFETLDNWTIQYKDDEEQWVTFSTDEELEFAAKLMGNKLNLQLVSNIAQNHEPGKHRECGSDKHEKDSNVSEPAKRDEKQAAKLVGKQETRDARIAQQRDRVNEKLAAQRDSLKEKISTLQASENPKVAGQVEKLKRKLDAINARLETPQKEAPKAAPVKDAPIEKEEKAVAQGNSESRSARLVQHRDLISERLSALLATNNPKVAPQIEKLQKKLADVNAKLELTIKHEEKKKEEALKRIKHEEKKKEEALKREQRNEALKVALLTKREALNEKITVLRSSSIPKAQVQLTKLEESVKSIDAKLLKLQPASTAVPEKPLELVVAENFSYQKIAEKSPEENEKSIVPVNNSPLVEARMKDKALRFELQQYKTHIGSMAKFLRVLRKNPAKGDENLAQQTENFLGLLQTAFTDKKGQVSDNATVMKGLMKAHLKMKADANKKAKKAADNKAVDKQSI